MRVKNFDEVNCGYELEDALNEAERCLLCPDPACVAGCPVNINIPKFIEAITAKDLRGAYDVITASNLLASVCGRVCPQETQCEGVCVVGETLEPVAIGRLERFVGDNAIKEKWSNVPYIEPNGFKIGIVGSGPAGMACAADHGESRVRCDGFRGLPSGRRRAQIRHPRFPPAQHGGRRRNRQFAQARRQVRVQYTGRPPVHHRADARRTRLRRRLHRHRRRLSLDARHPRAIRSMACCPPTNCSPAAI